MTVKDNAPPTSILFYTGIPGAHFGGVTVNEVISEGYRTGELVMRGLTREHMQAFADWALTLPPEQYTAIEQCARSAERYLLTTDGLGYRIERTGRRP
jgi:hypothetical protein